MKTIQISLILLTILIFSCEKKNETPINQNLPNQSDHQQVPPNNGANNTPNNGDTRPPSTPNKMITIGIFGDLNGGIGDLSYATTVTKGVPNLLAQKPNIILGTGDYIGGEDYRNTLSSSRFSKMWNFFNSQILQQFKDNNIPFTPTPGNHDANMTRERKFYSQFWNKNIPNVTMVSAQMYPFYYSFTFQGIFFISMDDVRTTKLRDRSFNGVTQREWIIEQLSSTESKGALARIVYGHVPIYPVLSKRKHAKKKKRGKYYEVLSSEQQNKSSNSLERILKDGNVSLAIFGHSHAYYPGVVQHKNERIDQSLNILSMPCLGYGNRYLENRTSSRSERGYGIIKINPKSKQLSYDVFNYNGDLIQKNTLPKKISPYKNVDIRRWDSVYTNNTFQL